MGGLIAYLILAGFLWIAVKISNRLVKIFGWSLSPNKLFFLRAGVFFGIFFVLFFDHIVGAIQFEYVCHRKVMLKLEPDWKDVQRARTEEHIVRQKGYAVPTSCTDNKYYDIDTEKLFFSYTFCRRAGSFLFRKMLDINLGDTCHPKDLRSIAVMLDTETLLKKGKMQ